MSPETALSLIIKVQCSALGSQEQFALSRMNKNPKQLLFIWRYLWIFTIIEISMKKISMFINSSKITLNALYVNVFMKNNQETIFLMKKIIKHVFSYEKNVGTLIHENDGIILLPCLFCSSLILKSRCWCPNLQNYWGNNSFLNSDFTHIVFNL